MRFFKLVARLFSPESKEEVVEKVQRIKTDPRVSEPVFMMLESMRKHPKRWRVELDLEEYDPDREFRIRIRHMGRGDCTTAVNMRITDRGVGEVYQASLMLPLNLAERLAKDKALRRAPDEYALTDLVMAPHGYYPNWLNDVEARELHSALSRMMYDRISKVIERQGRVEARRVAAQQAEIEQKRLAERQRLITVYGGHKHE